MPLWICQHCGNEFKRNRSGARPIRFCSQVCYRGWADIAKPTGGQFKKGSVPWTKGRKGIHMSPETQFKKGQASTRRLPVGSVTFRTRSREGYPRAFVKIAEPQKWIERARFVWAEANGPIPRGMVIHHRDRDAINDDLDNLQMVTKREHRMIHDAELTDARLAALSPPAKPTQDTLL